MENSCVVKGQEIAHLKISELVCVECNLTVCSKCIKNHVKHSVVDQDDMFQEIRDSGKTVLEGLARGLEASRTKVQNEFLEVVKEPYEYEMGKVTTHFGKLLELLTGTRTKIDTVFGNNLAINKGRYRDYTETITREITGSSEFLERLQGDISVLDHAQLIELFLNVESVLTYYKDPMAVSYVEYTLSDKDLPTVDMFLETCSTLLSMDSIHYSRCKTMVYAYGEAGFEQYKLDLSETSRIDSKEGEELPPLADDKLIYQNASFDGKTYIFVGDNFYVHDQEKGTWRAGHTSLPKGLTRVSTVLYGREWIYLFGGLENGVETRLAARFNVSNETTEIIGMNALPVPFAGACLSSDISKKCIYIIGGTSKAKSYLSLLEKFDVVSGKCESVLSEEEVLKKFGRIDSGCFVPHLQSFYILCQDNSLQKYSVSDRSLSNLNQPNDFLMNKMIHDGGNSIYFLTDYILMEINIYKFNLVDNSFSITPFKFLNCFSFNNYFSISNK